MKYLIIGAGGTGGCIAAYMHKAGKDVTLIARGKHLEAIQKNGLTINRQNDVLCEKVTTVLESKYTEKADVIFVCVKFYSVQETYTLIKKASHDKTIVIPVLNVFGTGEKITPHLPGIEVLNGCIYIAAAIKEAGIIKQSGSIFRIVYGRLDGNTTDERLHAIKKDLEDSTIDVVLSSNIKSDTLRKFSFVSCMGIVGTLFGVSAGAFQKEGDERKTFINAIQDVVTLGKSMNIELPIDIVDINLRLMDNTEKELTTSMQKDIEKGGNSELDGLLFEVIRLAKKHGVEVPTYQKIAESIGKK